MKNKFVLLILIINILIVTKIAFFSKVAIGKSIDERVNAQVQKTYTDIQESKLKNIIIEKNIKVNDDIFELIDTFINHGTIIGDIFVVGKKLCNKGLIHGDILGATLLSDIRGEIKGDIRLIAKNFEISGIVYKNVTAFVDKVMITDDGVVDGSITVFGNEAYINGLIGTDIRGKVNRLTITGEVKGDIDIEAKEIVFGTKGKIKGDLNYISEHEIPIPRANIHGKVGYTKKVTLYNRLELEKKIRRIKLIIFVMETYRRILMGI